MIFEKLARPAVRNSSAWTWTALPWTPRLRIWGPTPLDIVEMTMAVEEEFGLEDMDEEDLSGISTVADLVRYLKPSWRTEETREWEPAAAGLRL